MKENAYLLITALLSGLIATGVTIFWQHKNQVREEKLRIFRILMSTRFDITVEESVKALNMIDIVFYSSEKVRKAWMDFINATEMPDSQTKSQVIQDKHLRLLELIGEDIGYKKIKWENIKHYYYPVGLSNRSKDETILRKVQIDAAIAQINSTKVQPEAANANMDEALKQQFVLKALDNPEAVIKLMEVAEKAQSFMKSNPKMT